MATVTTIITLKVKSQQNKKTQKTYTNSDIRVKLCAALWGKRYIQISPKHRALVIGVKHVDSEGDDSLPATSICGDVAQLYVGCLFIV